VDEKATIWTKGRLATNGVINVVNDKSREINGATVHECPKLTGP